MALSPNQIAAEELKQELEELKEKIKNKRLWLKSEFCNGKHDFEGNSNIEYAIEVLEELLK